MRFLLCGFAIASITGYLKAQPYLDVASVSFAHGPARLGRAEVALSIPLSVGKGKVVLSPYWEHWQAHIPQQRIIPDDRSTEDCNGWVLPVTWLTPLRNDRWKLLFTGLVRYNTLITLERSSLQPGGAFLASYAPRPSITWKAGAYVNGDAFGIFWLPLLGIDWRAGPKLNVWGVLPGSLNVEHKVLRSFHWGLAFKAFTNSYGERHGYFARVNENQVGLFVDTYLLEHRFVFRAEVGHSALSRYQGGPGHPRYAVLGSDGYVDHAMGNGPYLKLLVAYRVRLDEQQAQK